MATCHHKFGRDLLPCSPAAVVTNCVSFTFSLTRKKYCLFFIQTIKPTITQWNVSIDFRITAENKHTWFGALETIFKNYNLFLEVKVGKKKNHYWLVYLFWPFMFFWAISPKANDFELTSMHHKRWHYTLACHVTLVKMDCDSFSVESFTNCCGSSKD